MTRLDVGVQFEHTVAVGLTRRGWEVEPFGQALLTNQAKRWLRRTQIPVRWLPDLIARRGADLIVVDAKHSLRLDRHAVETAAVRAAQGFERWTGLTEWLVFPDWCACRPSTVVERGEPGRYGGNGGGSGTPFHLIACTTCLPAPDVFATHRSEGS